MLFIAFPSRSGGRGLKICLPTGDRARICGSGGGGRALPALPGARRWRCRRGDGPAPGSRRRRLGFPSAPVIIIAVFGWVLGFFCCCCWFWGFFCLFFFLKRTRFGAHHSFSLPFSKLKHSQQLVCVPASGLLEELPMFVPCEKHHGTEAGGWRLGPSVFQRCSR